MKLHTVLGVGFGNRQSFKVSSHWMFRGGRFFVDYPHDGLRFIDDIRIYKANCHIPKNVAACCGFYNYERHGLYTDRYPEENADKVTIALVVNGFICFYDYRHLQKRVVKYFKRIEDSKTSITILVLSSRRNVINFDIIDEEGNIRTFRLSLTHSRKGKHEVKIVEFSDLERSRFWQPIFSLIYRFFRPPWKPGIDYTGPLKKD